MITEKNIKKTKFFTTDGSDIWKVISVETIKQVRLQNCETERVQGCLLGEDTAKEFTPIKMPKILKKSKKGKVKREKGKVEKENAARRPNTRGHSPMDSGIGRPSWELQRTQNGTETTVGKPASRRGKNLTSRYKGVTTSKPTRGGEKRFRAQVYKDKKNHSLGTFESEELAAAAIAEFLGDKDQAKLLRELALKSHGESDGVVVSAWKCNRCGHQISSSITPSACEKCGNISIRKI